MTDTAKKQKKPKQVEKPEQITAIVMQEVALTPRQTGIVNAETPKAMVKTKPGRGGKSVQYIEGGYVISQLNAAFSPLGWEFKVTERGETQRKNESKAEGEVWVYGEITIIDHKNGYRTTKGQYGQHPIHEKVPIGDAYKAAATDALKKCASLLGIGLDVYWGGFDEGSAPPKAPSKQEVFERAKMMIAQTRDMGALFAYLEKLKQGGGSLTKEQTKEMMDIVNKRLQELDHGSEDQSKR